MQFSTVYSCNKRYCGLQVLAQASALLAINYRRSTCQSKLSTEAQKSHGSTTSSVMNQSTFCIDLRGTDRAHDAFVGCIVKVRHNLAESASANRPSNEGRRSTGHSPSKTLWKYTPFTNTRASCQGYRARYWARLADALCEIQRSAQEVGSNVL